MLKYVKVYVKKKENKGTFGKWNFLKIRVIFYILYSEFPSRAEGCREHSSLRVGPDTYS